VPAGGGGDVHLFRCVDKRLCNYFGKFLHRCIYLVPWELRMRP
jgi:hypothetical protein